MGQNIDDMITGRVRPTKIPVYRKGQTGQGTVELMLTSGMRKERSVQRRGHQVINVESGIFLDIRFIIHVP